jgi:hypothetical protein
MIVPPAGCGWVDFSHVLDGLGGLAAMRLLRSRRGSAVSLLRLDRAFKRSFSTFKRGQFLPDISNLLVESA